MSSGRSGAAAHRADAAVKTARPARSSRRRPSRSPSRPALTTSVVTVSRYASTTHCVAENEEPNPSSSVGRATLAMLVPSDDSSIGSDSAASAHRSVVAPPMTRR
jgi:hypothetical protein